MMLYQNRIFVATSEVYDLADTGGFQEIVSEAPPVPRIFVPTGTKIYDESVIRMGVLGIYSHQKALHHWFTSDCGIEVTEADWLDAVPPIPDTDLNVMTFVIFETATHAYGAILRRATTNEVMVEDISAQQIYSMELIEIKNPEVMFTDSLVIAGDQFASFRLQETLHSLPVAITGQLILDMFNLLDKRQLNKWQVCETDAMGINEIPIEPCSRAQINGYAQFLNTAPPRDSKLFS